MTYDPAEVEVAALRVVRARQAAELAQLRHIMKHTAAGIAAARNSLGRSRERLCAMVASADARTQVETFLGIVDLHLGTTERVCVEQKCGCEETDVGQALAKARDAQKKAEQLAVERGFLNSTDPNRPRGKVINLGSRLKPARVYEQAPGQPLRAVDQCERRTDEEFAAAHDLPEGPGAA